MTDRPDWTEYGLEMAFTAALRSDCTRRNVGAVLMLGDGSIVVTGYNGGPPKGESCLKGECPRGLLTTEQLAPNSDYSEGAGKCVALHAEWNVLLRASWHQMDGYSKLFVTSEPCHLCWTLIKGTKIGNVVYSTDGTSQNYVVWDRWEDYLDLIPGRRQGYIKGERR